MSEQEFLKKLSATYNTPIVPPVVAPKVKSTNNAGMANSSTPSKVQKPTAQQLKEELRQLPFAAREALRKNAFVDQQGRINIPSMDAPELGRFGGLTFTKEEWDQGYSSVYAQGQTIGPATGQYTRLPENVMPEDPYSTEFIVKAEAERNAADRRTRVEQAERQAGLEYIDLLKGSQPIKDPYREFKWTDPVSYVDQLTRAGDIMNRATRRAGVEAVRGIAGTVEALSGDNPYLQFARNYAENVNIDLGVLMKSRPDVFQKYDTQKGFLEGGYADPAYYVDAIASAVPHMVGALGASILGAGATGSPLGGAAAAFTYGASVETGSMYNEMLDRGFNLDDARTAAQVYGTIAGGLDSIVPGEIGGKIMAGNARKILDEAARQEVKRGVLGMVGKGGLTMLKEGGTETMQEFANNVTISFYDKSQSWWDNLPDAFVGGALGGALFGAVGVGTDGQVDSNLRKPPIQAEPTPQAGEPVEAVSSTEPAVGTEQAGPTMGAEPDTTAGNLEQQINDLFEAARAEEAAVQIGQKVLEQDGPNAVIEQAVQDARTALSEYNNQAKMVLEQYARNSAQPVIANDNVQVSLGTIPDGRFVASGTITIGNRGYDVPFDVKNAQATQGEAIASVVGDLTGWMTETLSTEGIIDDAAVANVVETLSNADQLYSNMDSFVYANQDAVLAAQDAASVEDFQATMTEQDISINENMDLNQFFKKATSADAVYLTKAAAKQVAQDLAGDLGVDVKFVDEIATNKRALGRFVQQVYGGQIQPGGTIEMRAEGDRTQDGDAVIRMSTPYHEAAHAYFRNLLLPEEQKAILDELRAEKRKEGISDADAEEILVEDLKNTVFKKKKRETRYGKILARLIEMTERVLKWLGGDPMSKVERFYEDVLSKKRPSERKAAEIARRKQGLQDVREEYFQEPTRLTSKYLKFKEIAGKEFVSFQQAMNAVKGAGLKQAEADIITAVLETQFKDQKKISVAALQDAIIGELLPLEVKDSMKYADYGLGNVQMSGWDATTHIYDGPVEHDISGHFGGETTKLFGHTRIAQKGKVRAITEVQSDFFQKTRTGRSITMADTSKLDPYANIWHERMIKEEIRLAAMDGVKTLRIVTPRTLAFIEQYVGTGDDIPYTYDDESGDVLQVGDVISMDGYDYYVFESDESSIVVVGKESGTTVPRTKDSYEMDFEGTTYYFPRERSETLSQPIAYKSGAGFSVDDLPEVQRNTYDFYKNKVNPYFKKLRKDNVREVTDENGFTWLETDITKQDAQAVEAFQTEEPIMYRGGKIQSIGELDLTASAELVRQGVLDLGSVFAEGPGYYFSSDREDANRYGDVVLKVKGKEGARILTKNDKLTQREVSRILDSIDEEILEGAASNWSQSLFEGRQALIREIMSGDNALDQLMSVWADIYYWQNPDQFLDVMQKNGIDGIRVDKPGGIQHTVMYNKEALIELAGEVEAFQDFDEVELPAKKGMDPMKVVGYKMFPADEAARYVGVAKAVTEDTRRVKSADEQELMRIARTVETAYKYEEYLLRTYGIGYEDLVTNMVQELAAEVEMRLSVAAEFSTAGEGSGMLSLAQTAEVARTVAKKLGVLSRAYKKVTTRKVSAGDFGDIFDMHSTLLSYTTRTPSPDPVVIEAVQILGNAMDRIEELADPDRIGDGDMRDAIEQVNAMIRRSIDSNGRVRFSTFTGEVDNAYTAMNKMSKQYDATVRLRAQLQQMRTRRIEKEEVALRTKMERNTKRRIHQNIMKNGEIEPTITMNQREFYGAQAKTAEEVAKATKKEMREQYKLATQRKDLMRRIEDTKKKYTKAIKEGKLVDVRFAENILALFDSFQKSQPTQKTLDALDVMLEAQRQATWSQVGQKFETTSEGEFSTFTEDDAKAMDAKIEQIQKRLTQRPLSTMTNEELGDLYDHIKSVIEEGRVAFQIGKYVTEEDRKKRIASVVAETVPLDNGKLTRTVTTMLGERAGRVSENFKQNAQDYLSAPVVVDEMDGGKFGQGKNSDLLRTLNQGEYLHDAEKKHFADALMAKYVALGVPKVMTEKEQAFVTLHARLREEGGEFLVKLIADKHFGGEIPEQVGKVTAAQAEAIVDMLLDIREEYDITNRQAGTWQARTNKLFPRMKNYVMKSAFKNPPKDWLDAMDGGIDTMQTFGRNGTGVSDKFSLERRAQNEKLDPRVDFMNLYLETVDHALWYIHMQPAIDQVQQVVGSRDYAEQAGTIATTWWKEHLMLTAQRGAKVGARRIAAVDKLRSNVTVGILSFKASTILMQGTQPINGAFTVMPYLGLKGALRVLGESMQSLVPGYVQKAADEAESVIARGHTMGMYDVRDARRSMEMDKNKVRNFVSVALSEAAEKGMWAMQRLDVGFFAAARQAAYKELLDQGKTEEEAGKMADYLAEIANSSSLVSMRPHVYSDGSFTRLFLMLQSFSIGWFSTMSMIIRGTIKSGNSRQRAYGLIAALGAPLAQSLFADMVGRLVRGEGDDEEEKNLAMRILSEYAYQMPLIGGVLRARFEYGRSEMVNSAALSTLGKLIEGVDTALKTEGERRDKAVMRASEALFTALGIPFTAQAYDVFTPFLKKADEKVNDYYKESGKQLSFNSFSDSDIDRAVEASLAKAYGDTLPEMTTKQKTEARKKVIKAAAQADSNKFVGLIAKATKNDDKARVLIEAKGAMEYREFDRMVDRLQEVGLLSEEGYKKYLELQYK